MDKGPFYHGTAAALKAGDLLKAGHRSNYNSEVVMNHIYFTALLDGAGFAADLVSADHPHVYEVEPLGDWEDDPNVTDKKFPGNPTRSYRSGEPLKIIREINDWQHKPEVELTLWREKMKRPVGKILN